MEKKKLKLLDVVALLHDLPSSKMRQGQIGTIVHVYKSGQYDVEFADEKGKTLSLAALPCEDLLRLFYGKKK